MNEELIMKARTAKSPEELMALAKENGIELDEDGARSYFEQLNKSGELSDEELDNVSGGGCHIKVGRKKYTVVTNHCRCLFGYGTEWENWLYVGRDGRKYLEKGAVQRPDSFWYWGVPDGCCGTCLHLMFAGGIGYCELS